MKQRFLKIGLFSGLGLLFALPLLVSAATTITSPSVQCFQAGSIVTFTWNLDPTASHSYVSVWQGSTQPTYQNNPGNNIVANTPSHYAVGPVAWTAPSSTSTVPYQLYVESHDGGHNNINTALSSPFNIDANPPAAPTLSPGATTDTTADIAWTAASNPGCEGVRGYRVYRNGTLVKTTTETFFSDTGLAPSTLYNYKVQAFDNFASGAESLVLSQMTKPAIIAAAPPPNAAPSPTLEVPTAQSAEAVKELNLMAPKIDIPDTSKIPQATSPSRLDGNSVSAETKPEKASNLMFYAGVAVLTIVGGGGVFLIVNRFAPKL